MKVINKNSKGANNQEPSPSTMEYGEIAVNYNATNPRILIKDSSNKVVGFPSENKVNEGFTSLDNKISNVTKTVTNNNKQLTAVNTWINTPLTDAEILSAFA